MKWEMIPDPYLNVVILKKNTQNLPYAAVWCWVRPHQLPSLELTGQQPHEWLTFPALTWERLGSFLPWWTLSNPLWWLGGKLQAVKVGGYEKMGHWGAGCRQFFLIQLWGLIEWDWHSRVCNWMWSSLISYRFLLWLERGCLLYGNLCV